MTVMRLSVGLGALLVCLLAETVEAKGKIKTPPPGPVLEESHLESLGPIGFYARGFALESDRTQVPLLPPDANGTTAQLLRRLDAAGRLSGFGGFVYDNRDRGHSRLGQPGLPRVQHLNYAAPLIEKQMDYGLGGQIIFPVPVIGNSSTAITKGPRRRSQVRQAMTSGLGPARAFAGYANNQLYVYPEHRDHDDSDFFPANWPYTVTSQGSSKTDQPFIYALAVSLAALTPETRAFVEKHKLVAPTLQMVLRRSMKPILSRADYLSGKAHPSAFEKRQVQRDRMITLANALTPESVPPLVRLEIEEETFVDAADYAGLSERLFTTPGSIARVWRGAEFTKRFIVTTEGTENPAGTPLTYSWVLLRGDPELVRIKPLDEVGGRVEIEIDWHNMPMRIGDSKRSTSRIDIGVFAYNGIYDSAPSFISVSFPLQQERIYEDAGDGSRRIASIDYDATGRRRSFDPLLHWTAPWRDEFHYDPETGRATHVTRHMRSWSVDLLAADMTRDGRKVFYEMGPKVHNPTIGMGILADDF